MYLKGKCKMETRKTITVALTFVFALCLFMTGCASKQGEESGMPQATQNLPIEGSSSTAEQLLTSFSATALDGSSFTQEDFAGKDITLINFWGTFCAPCIEEMPELQELAEELPDNIGLITVCVDAIGAEDDVKKIIETAGFKGTTLISGDDAFQTLCDQMMALPTTIFVDGSGSILGDGHMMDDLFEEGAEEPNAPMGIIAGGGSGMKPVYVRAINRALRTIGKDEISLES